MRSLLFRNLILTIPTALIFTVVGYAVSLPMSFHIDAYALKWQFNFRSPSDLSIQTQRLDNLRKFQTMVALGSTILGVIVAQTTFVVYTLVEKGDRGSQD
ncbi:hypothetical protein [Halotia branconii]|uniref:Uncharacterized protein n=1 Tax=Halotia branconii CENA392 TaxID=1539056 RepID=A0AAJ6NS43_9CYAN|nr:hypothetical protein [Halotia branconii]WGV25506.1 hypothetical protein QI031_27875 [Halotia branconii CENA392]